MKNILICSNSDRAGGCEITELVCEKILSVTDKLKVFFPFRSAEEFKYQELLCLDVQAELARSGLLICLGGDGTLLYGSRLAAAADIPLLGINFGHKGFIASLEPDELDMLDSIIRGDYSIEERMMVAVRVIRGEATAFSDFGLNDALIRSVSSHLIRPTVFCDGAIMSEFAGDGLIVATPTGSTAYSMSAGGPIVEPGAKNLIITPICAHALNARTIILGDNRTVTVSLKPSEGFNVVLSVDGKRDFALEHGDRIEIKKSSHVTKLVNATRRNYYEIVNKKLNTDL
jgi:NAD+ kinase